MPLPCPQSATGSRPEEVTVSASVRRVHRSVTPRAELRLERIGEGDGLPVVRLDGEYDLDTVPEIDRLLRRTLGPFYHREHLIMDLDGVRFIDSSFVGYLVTLVTRLHAEHRELVLTRPRGHVRRVLVTVGLPNVIPMYESLEEALATLLSGRLPVIPPRFSAAGAV
jgi:anti-anti-sigma factor